MRRESRIDILAIGRKITVGKCAMNIYLSNMRLNSFGSAK
jgi:hypothetical protein